MAPTNRPEGQLNLNLSSLSPIAEPNANTNSKSPFGNSKSANGALPGLTGARVGAGSPSHEQTSRLFPKRTRELATPAGSSNIWGPPTSGTSTPLFEIPESPDHDGFPDLVPLVETGINSPARRGRAGTLPSRISPVGTISGAHSLTSKTSRPTPSTSPFRPSSTSAAENAFNGFSTTSTNAPLSSNSVLLSRLRAGSMPQKSSLLSSSSTLGQSGSSGFSSAWSSRSRAATLTSIHSADESTSPPHISHARDGLADPGVRTLDYLGLAESSYNTDTDAFKLHSNENMQPLGLSNSLLNNVNSRTSNRFRSFSVNTQPKNNLSGFESGNGVYPLTASGAMTPSAQAALEAELEAVQERVRLHNQAVQAFALNANAARPRARTAGLVETPQRPGFRGLGPPGATEAAAQQVDSSVLGIGPDPRALTESFYDLNLGDNGNTFDTPEDVASQVSRSLWIGSIPNSTTVSSLDAIFANYGAIESTRVLTHKNCGFVNYENIQDAVRARQLLNGKEIFPGAGPVRIGFAKAPNTSTNTGLEQTGISQPLLLDGFTKQNAALSSQESGLNHDTAVGQSSATRNSPNPNGTQSLSDVKPNILQIVSDFGAQQQDLPAILGNLDTAEAYQNLVSEIPAVPEPSPNRIYDAPRLRDIRKRIDHGTCGPEEIEHIAIDMLPEIAELSSDYLGNTVVQKLFEFCSEPAKEQMLAHIAPHLAEIGIHKNGTWAAQKIIEVCKTESQTRMIVDHLRPYTVPLFLDQYGNYVLQCCLKFGAPYNDFIFETMLSQLWEISQGRFGARAMRACLESHHATKNQQRMLAAAIALHSVKLATNANGALLLTWLLDTCTFPRRRSVLAPMLIPHLVQLCTHKVAYLTVLKVVNQRNEPEARELVIKSLFFNSNDDVLEQILSDQASGVTLIFKILTNPFLDDNNRPEIMQKISNILESIKAQPNQGYKRLMDEVGMSSRPTQGPVQSFGGPTNVQPKPAQNIGGMHYGGYLSNVHNPAFDSGPTLGRTVSNESYGYSNYGMNGFPQSQPSFDGLMYQQPAPQNQYNGFPPHLRANNALINHNYNGYASPPPAVDALRGMQNAGSPLGYPAQMNPLVNAGTFNAQPYGQSQAPGNMYNYNGGGAQGPYYFSPPVQTIHAGGRGRRGR